MARRLLETGPFRSKITMEFLPAGLCAPATTINSKAAGMIGNDYQQSLSH